MDGVFDTWLIVLSPIVVSGISIGLSLPWSSSG